MCCTDVSCDSIASMCGTKSWPTTRTLIWESSMMWSISGGVSRQLMPTLIALIFPMPKATSKYSTRFLSRKPTQVCSRTPAARSEFATWLERWSSSPYVTDLPSNSIAILSACGVPVVRTMSASDSCSSTTAIVCLHTIVVQVSYGSVRRRRWLLLVDQRQHRRVVARNGNHHESVEHLVVPERRRPRVRPLAGIDDGTDGVQEPTGRQ